jgi:ketosteroid isomerase-like protein
MSQEDIETLRAGYLAVSNGDWDAASRDWHPDFELTTGDRVMNAGTHRGRDAARRFWEDLREPFEEVVVTPEQFFERGDSIVVFLLVRARPRGSGALVETRIGHLWTMRDGRMVGCKIFPVREEALEAVGLSEQDAPS